MLFGLFICFYPVFSQEFFHEKEREFLIEYSTPRLSLTRVRDPYNLLVQRGYNTTEEKQAMEEGKMQKKKRTKIIHKSVQTWIPDIRYEKYYDNLHEVEDNDNYEVLQPVLFKLSKRLELASGLNVTAKYASTEYQTTNYGLGGLCEIHFDPGGYIEGIAIPDHDPAFKRLLKQGDMIATFMGWLEDVPAGGATAFCAPLFENLVWPTKGAVGFWFDVDRKGHRDQRTLHGGCPIIKGSKWILNKWLYFYDQFEKLPCALGSEEKQRPFRQHY